MVVARIGVLLAALCVVGCDCHPLHSGDGGPGHVCDPGTTQTCACPLGVQGAQICADGGTSWEDCRCGATDSGPTDSMLPDAAAACSPLCVPPKVCEVVGGQPQCVLHKVVDTGRAADILFVIDNSGSMAEEQQNLARSASSIGSGTAQFCDQAGFDTLKPYIAANPETPREQWPQNMRNIYDDCGFIERLLLFGNKFHIGVVTTDSGDCDRPYGSQPPRGSEPQRGCLHSSPSDPGLTVLKWDTPDLPQKFYNMVTNLLTFGSAYEKGLAMMEHFLTPGHNVPAATACTRQRDCTGDYAAFWRDQETNASGTLVETKLVIVFLTDEEDCSHTADLNEDVSGNTDLCYTRPDLLIPTDHYLQFVRNLKPRAELLAMGLIGGLYDLGSGLRPSGCKLSGEVVTDQCMLPRGNSAATCSNCSNNQPICMCHPAIAAGTNGCDQSFPAANCCSADPAARYFTVATQMNTFEVEAICSPDYKATLIGIADLVNEPTSFALLEMPLEPAQIAVQLKGARWSGQWTDVPYCGANCGNGWNLVDNNTRIKFYGTWVPQTGDEFRVILH